MLTTNNVFIAQFIAALNKAGWSLHLNDGWRLIDRVIPVPITLEGPNGLTVTGLIRDEGELGYRLWLERPCLTHQEHIEHVQHLASDHLSQLCFTLVERPRD